MLAPWKKSCDQPRQHIKKQRHYFANKCPSSQSYDFSMYGWESLTIKKAECWRIDGFKLWCWRRLLRVPSVQFSPSVTSNSLQPHGLQHARFPVHHQFLELAQTCPSSWWCHPTISSSVIPFSFCLQSFPASGSFKWVSSLHHMAKVLEIQLQHQSFQWIFRTVFL